MHNRMVMRRLSQLPVALALLLAFFMAPYQHVHLATNHREDADHDHDDAVVVHIHFNTVSVPTNRNSGPSLDVSDGDHVSRSLDTFTTMPQAGFAVLARPESRLLLFPPADRFVGVVEVTEPRGHDPPFFEFSVPRAPPV
jgi:hypothetical protein